LGTGYGIGRGKNILFKSTKVRFYVRNMSLNTAMNIVFCTAIVLLLAFIIRENAMNYDYDVQLLAQKTAQNGQSVIAASNKELLREGIKQTKDYPSPMAEEYRALTHIINLKSDSIQYLLDSSIKSEDVILLSAIQGMLHQQRSLIIKMSNFDKSIEAVLPSFLPAEWLYQSWENDTKEQHKTVLEQAKMIGLSTERVALGYFVRKVTGYSTSPRFKLPGLNWKFTNLTIRDTMYADILLGSFTYNNFDEKFFVNGIPTPHKTFQQRFDQAGIYPLHVRVESNDWEHDTLLVAEKTYFIKVGK
jgi:hypothetical protein